MSEFAVASSRSIRPGRRAAAAGVAFLVVDLVAILLVGPLPSIDDSTGDLADFYRARSGDLLAQAYVRGLSMALLVLFIALLAAHHRGDRRGPGFALWVGSAVIVAAVELVRIAVVAAVALQPDRLDGSTIAALHTIGLVLGAVIAFPIAAGQVGACLLLRAARRQRWLVTTGAALAIAWLVTGARSVSTVHALWTAGTVVTFAWGLWLLALCVDAVRPRGDR